MSLGRDSFCKINENENKRKINIDLAVVASQMLGGVIHDIYDRSPHGHIDIRESQRRARIKKERMRSEGLDGGIWSAFWLAILGTSANFLSIFFVCDSNSCILIKTSRVQGKGQAILPSFSSFLL